MPALHPCVVDAVWAAVESLLPDPPPDEHPPQPNVDLTRHYDTSDTDPARRARNPEPAGGRSSQLSLEYQSRALTTPITAERPTRAPLPPGA